MPWRNYQHLAARAFNQPLLLEPAYARVFFSVLGERFGASRMIDAVTGHAYASDELKQMAISWDDDGGRRYKAYRVENGIAVLPVSGTLVHKFGYLQPISGMTGYDGLAMRLQAAISDPDVKGIMLDIDSPGGEVAGAFDTADLIARMGAEKPIWSLASDVACSAAYLLASATGKRLITQTGRVGSIGVVVAHRNIEKRLEDEGIDITLIYSGAHKVDGNPYQRLPDDVRADIQTAVDSTREMFAGKVAEFTGMSKEAVMATEASVFEGNDAVVAGLADQVVNYADAVSVMAASINKRGVDMTGTTKTGKSAQVEDTQEPGKDLPVTETATLSTAQAAEAELNRVMSILECDEAKGREPLARALAKMPGMSLESAREALLAAPVSAQAQTETALDTLMSKESPDAVTSGQPARTEADARLSGLRKAATRFTGELL